MHSRIFGIVTKKHYDNYVKKEDEMEMPLWQFEESLPDGMDYVDDDTDLNEDYEWLIEYLCKRSEKLEYNVDTHEIKFLKGFKEEYFKESWDKIKGLIEAPNAFNEFCNNTMLSFKIGDAANERYSFYQCDEEGDYETFDDFIRQIKLNQTYVVFGSLDYHS